MNDTVGRRNPAKLKNFSLHVHFLPRYDDVIFSLDYLGYSRSQRQSRRICLFAFVFAFFVFVSFLSFVFVLFCVVFFLVFNFCFCFVFWQKLRVTLIVAAREPLDWSYFLTHSNYLSVSASKMSGEQYHRSHRKIRRLCRLPQSPA